MKDTIADILRALFVSEGRLIGVKALLATMTIGTVCVLALAGDDIPEVLRNLAIGFGGLYFGASIAKGRG